MSKIYVVISESGGVLFRGSQEECLTYIYNNNTPMSIIYVFDTPEQRRALLFDDGEKESRYIYKDFGGQKYNVSKETLNQFKNNQRKHFPTKKLKKLKGQELKKFLKSLKKVV